MKNDASTDSDEQEASLAARCTDCDDLHPLGDRQMDGVTTICPACGSPSYRSEPQGDQTIKPDDERIADAVRDINGVGDQTLENIIEAFSTYYEFEAATERELRQIEGVGKQTAARITQ